LTSFPLGASIIGAAAQATVSRVQAFNKDRCFTLLVIDDQNTDWSKYFRGKRLHGDYDIRVEQADFSEITVVASGEAGPTVSIVSYRSGSKVICATIRCRVVVFVVVCAAIERNAINNQFCHCRRQDPSGLILCWSDSRHVTVPAIIVQLCWA